MVQRILSDIARRRSGGENISDAQVVAAYPDLQPLLGLQLKAVRHIHNALIVGQRSVSPLGSIDVTRENHTEKPIEIIDDEQTVERSQWPAIDGYRIGQEISCGGQATVFKAVQESTNRGVAIKVLSGGPYAGSRGRARFKLESEILARLDHPNIVKIIDQGRASDRSFYLVMEYIEGCDLAERLTQLKGDLPAVLRLFIQISQAMDDAHRNGVVHRDLKPMNILIDRRGDPRIVDFGMASLCDREENRSKEMRLTRTGQLIGSLLWSSPEQVSGRTNDIDLRCDVYAIGVMLYHALTGNFPYPTDGSLQAILRHIATTRPAPFHSAARKLGFEVTPALEKTIQHALDKSPDQRYASAGLFADDLQSCLLGRSISARKSSAKRWIAISIVALVLTGTWISIDAERRVVQLPTLPNVVTLPSFENSVGMRFVRIPAGSSVIGSEPNEMGRSDNEQVRLVTIRRGFYLSLTVVTQRQYSDVMKCNPSDSRFRGPELPVQCVKWNDAVTFCRHLSAREGRTYRLPTEAEWEFACRAGSPSLYGDSNSLDPMGWYSGNSSLQLRPVAQKAPNSWGLYDMAGNVRQWCSDSTAESIYTDGPMGQSTVLQRELKIAKGGDFLEPANRCRAAARYFLEPWTAAPTLGFRVVCEMGEHPISSSTQATVTR